VKRGKLKVFLGAAPGVGKTYRMLGEAGRRAGRGTDVVVGFVECHGRRYTEAMLDGLEVVPRVEREYRDSLFIEMDLDEVLARRPAVALVDEMAHTNVPGGRNAKRWQDIQELLDAGIDVLSTINVQHLESVNDVVEKITGVPQRETVPDEVVRAADEIELVDMPAQALRRRMAHGDVYQPDKVDAALANYFRVGNLTALRELALLWVAGRVDDFLQEYRSEHQIRSVWETRERVVVALTGGPEGETIIRRAARIADRAGRGDLLAVHVGRSDGLAGASPAALTRQRDLVESLGGSYHTVVGDHIPTALLDFARAENATQLVMGTSRRGGLARFLGGRGIGETTNELSGDIDVHLVTHERARRGSLLPYQWGGHLPLTRRVLGPVAALLLPALLTLGLNHMRGHLNLTSETLLYLLTVIGVACISGVASAVLASVCASILLDYFFIPPLHRFTIDDANNVLALAVFTVVAVTVATIVDHSLRQSHRAAKATAEAETLSSLAGSVLRGEQAVPELLERTREIFGMDSAVLVPRDAQSAGRPRVDSATTARVPVGPDDVLELRGRRLAASESRVLNALAAHIAAALEHIRLAETAAQLKPLRAADQTRSALLTATGHDLRLPLAAAWDSVSRLRGRDGALSPEDSEELLDSAGDSLDRVIRLVDTLLDTSRIQAGAQPLRLEPAALAEIVPRALDTLPDSTVPVLVQGLEDVADVVADPPLLERVIANLVTNAVHHTPPGASVQVSASALADRIEMRIIDQGPGPAPEDRDRALDPFQRAGDTDDTTSALGLALARGLIEAMSGTIAPEDTPGGGLTMVVALPAAPALDEQVPA
jgi:two-component system sensor histidine kinase KdpD